MLKSESRLNPGSVQTGCSYQGFYKKSQKFAMVSCCCNGFNDPNCKAVTKAIKDKKKLCLKGDMDSDTDFYFASECPYTTVKRFQRDLQSIWVGSPSYRVTSSTTDPDTDFCSLQQGLSNVVNRCNRYYGETQKDDGCNVIFYRAEDQWYQSSAIWFDIKKSKLIHLYTTRLPGTDMSYTVSLGFLYENAVDSSCKDFLKQRIREYYVLNCRLQKCDLRFSKQFFYNLDHKIISDALQTTSIPLCETGNLTKQTTNLTFHEHIHTQNTLTRVYGVYCVVRLEIDFDNNNVYTINVSYGPVFPLPQDCKKHDIDFNDLKYTCCYNGSSNASYINPECHHSTILSVAHKLSNPDKDKDADPSDVVETIEPTTRQTVYEIPDDCTQKNIGFIGTPSQLCKPGGSGCFHLKGVDHAKENVMASCVGRAEQMVATREDAFERYHGALICLTEEARDTCHIVDDGIQKYYLCCCTTTEIRNNVAHCVKDSNLMFNSFTFEAKRIGEFKDDSEDDDEE